MQGVQSQLGDNLALVQSLSPDLYNGIVSSMTTLIKNGDDVSNGDYATAIGTLQGCLATLSTELTRAVRVPSVNVGSASSAANAVKPDDAAMLVKAVTKAMNLLIGLMFELLFIILLLSGIICSRNFMAVYIFCKDCL
jgi:hypothetical protein